MKPGWMPLLALLSLPSLAHGYGEPEGVEPHIEERALHFQTDRLRVDPGATDVQFDSYDPVRPLIYSADLHAAARFYADDMAENGCFPADHSSCDGTSFGERVSSFYGGSTIGENIAKGQPSAEFAVFDSWLYSDGHRTNMLSDSWNELGTGFGPNGSQPLWVQDFGFRGGVEEPVITSATHEPLRPSAESDTRFFAASFEPSGVDLADMRLVVTNACFDMEIDRGGDGMTTYVANAPTGPEGCMPYWFFGTTEAGDLISYPTEGSLLAPVGGASCDSWTDERRKADCAPSDLAGFSGSGGGCASGGAEAYPDANVGQNAEYGTCAQSGDSSPRWVMLLGVFGLLGRRRRV
ncbi:MAG: CAP domain-containing protein [Deltaproteobacteria bacterium]|nr:CAP domain-containing protein [Deltaproteobacteria bacterium]